MRIGRNTGDSFYSEVKRRQAVASFFHKRDYKPSQTGINVHRDVVFETELGNLFNGVNHSMRKTRCWCQKLKTKSTYNVKDTKGDLTNLNNIQQYTKQVFLFMAFSIALMSAFWVIGSIGTRTRRILIVARVIGINFFKYFKINKTYKVEKLYQKPRGQLQE